MNSRRVLCGVVIGATALAAACGRSEAPAETARPAEPLFKPLDPSQATDPLATPGLVRYVGILPCADCAGIRTELELLQDPASGEPHTYTLTETSLGRDGAEGKPLVTKGRWTIVRGLDEAPAATMFVLDGGGNAERARRFERLDERELRQLDRQGKRIASSLNYVLTRVSQAAAVMQLPPASVPVTGAAAAQPAAMVTDMAAGWPVNLLIGQEMTARLTTGPQGGRWALRAGSDGGVLALQGSPVDEAPAGGPRVQVFRLKAVKPGNASLTFDLNQGTGASPIKSVSYPVTVQ